MNLLETFILAAINEKKGRFYTSAGYLKYGAAGILLIELLRKKKIRLEGEKVVISDSTSTGEKLLDEALRAIRDSEGSKKAGHWVGALQRSLRHLDRRILENLEDSGYIRIDTENFLFIFPRRRLVVTHGTEKSNVDQRLKKALTEDTTRISAEDAVLASMASVCGFLRKNLSQWGPMDIKVRLKAVRSLKYFRFEEEDTSKILKAVQKAVANSNSAVYAGAVPV